MAIFDLYAAYYDLLYEAKDYRAEALYVDGLVKEVAPGAARLLELGCGTGGHAAELERLGYRAHGIDLSPGMVDRARKRAVGRQTLFFEIGDIRSYRTDARFDAVVSLFHVMSYQTRNEDLAAAVATARAHLNVGGVFVFDCWYGPAVLSDRPRRVTKTVSDDRIEVIRRTEPVMHVNRDCVDVHFDIEIRRRSSVESRRVEELHTMRYLFLPEIEGLLQRGNFALHAAHAWMTREEPSDATWYVAVVARAA